MSEWAIQERRWCPFFDISLRLEPEGGPLWLILTGRSGTKDFIKVDGAAWIKLRADLRQRGMEDQQREP